MDKVVDKERRRAFDDLALQLRVFLEALPRIQGRQSIVDVTVHTPLRKAAGLMICMA
jgi:hypothetical protein